MRRARHILVVALCCILAPLALPQEPAPDEASRARAVVERLEHELGQIETLQADFVQEKHVALLPKPLRTEGKLYFQQPESLCLETVSPERTRTVVRGRTVTRFERVGDNWQPRDTGRADAARAVARQMAAWFRGRFALEGDRTYAVAVRGDDAPLVSLTPNSPRMRAQIQRIELQFTGSPLRLESLTIREAGDDYTVMRFSNETRNALLPADLFASTAAR